MHLRHFTLTFGNLAMVALVSKKVRRMFFLGTIPSWFDYLPPFATNNYDDGKRPPTRPKPIVRPAGPKPSVAKPMLAANGVNTLFKMGGNIEMKTNCMPKPGDDMMLVLGYRNKVENGQQSLNGTIALMYNDVEFSNNNFDLAAARTYHNEKKSDLKQDEIIDAKNNAAKLVQTPTYKATSEGILITFPETIKVDENTVNFILFRTEDSNLDVKKEVTLQHHLFLIPAKVISKGSYTLKLKWKENKKPYQVDYDILWN
ncbi:MAG: hypothetical protein EOO07_29320 [Chitinophagaceae bacterium]|nr:MAG: hypothetical protein EOO07_29320 [Chitinophagaceae bacterium]